MAGDTSFPLARGSRIQLPQDAAPITPLEGGKRGCRGGSSGEAEAAPGGPELPFFKSLNLAPCPVALSPQRGHLS